MGTAEIIKWGRWRIAWASAQNAEAVSHLLRNGQIGGIGLCSHRGYDGDPAFIRGVATFAGIVITEPTSSDLEAVSKLDQLQFLSLGGPRPAGFDFSRLTRLRDLRMHWHKDDTLPGTHTSLESLYLHGYAPQTKDLRRLPAFSNLRSLELVRAKITELAGIERLSALRELDVSHCKGLQSVADLAGTGIERVHLESCPKIMDIPTLCQCPDIKSIRLSSSGDFESLGFLKASKSLEEFRFVKMKVLDGDMTPLLSLKSVGFTNRRGYSHTNEEINVSIARREGRADAKEAK